MSDAQEHAAEIERAIKQALAPFEIDGFMIVGWFKVKDGKYGSVGTMIWQAPEEGEGHDSPIIPLGRLTTTMFRAAEGWGVPALAVMASAMDADNNCDIEAQS